MDPATVPLKLARALRVIDSRLATNRIEMQKQAAAKAQMHQQPRSRR